ncbi:MAG: hypothetical protein LLG45_02340 [Actinomycetia bacterium]|nr:hypothetical protein [Actinomycetes bacterium]
MHAPSSPLQLDQYTIEAFSFKTNAEFDEAKKGEGILSVFPELLVHKTDERKVLLRLRVRYRPDPSNPDSVPYDVDVSGEGFFSLAESELSPEEERHLLLFNGSAILYGLLRAQIAQATALGPHGPMLLPVANLVPALKRKLKHQAKTALETKHASGLVADSGATRC